MKIQRLFFNGWLVVFAAVISIGSAQITFAAGAHEFDNPPCYDITGVSTPLLVGGVPNGGVIDFDDPGVGAAYQACVRMSSALPGAVPVRIEGWAWDENLGWVSMYCDGVSNLSVPCGAFSYSVGFATTGAGPDFTTVNLSGNAWGDNFGYISFNSAWHQTKPIASGVNRGLIDTSVGAAAYHAYADTVGWLDLRGVHLYWYDSDPPLTDPDVLKYVSICSSKDPLVPVLITDPKCSCDLDSGCVPTISSKIPDAGTADKYSIEIPFVYGGVKISNASIINCPATTMSLFTMGGAAYCAKIDITWEDDVDFDQTTALSQSQGAAAKFNLANGGAVTKPLSYSVTGMSDFLYDGAKTLWGANVKSWAPTSDRNVTDGMQNEKFYYANEGGLPGGYDKNKTDQNKLILKDLKLMFFKYSVDGITPGVCIYGNYNGANCEMKSYVSNASFSFNPLVEVTELLYVNSAGVGINFINATSVDGPQKFSEKVSTKAGVLPGAATSFNFGVENPGAASLNMKWVDSFPKANDVEPTSKNIHTIIDDFGGNNWLAQIFSSSPGSVISADAGPYVYSKTSYSVAGAPSLITYFGSKLPRIKAGLLLNPAAKIEGNVYVTDFAQKSADFSLRSLGNISSNLRREAVVRNVAKYLGGFSGTIGASDKTIAAGNAYASSGLDELVKDKVYYLKGYNLTFDCGAACTFDKNLTFIVENGNIFVNSDILSSDGKTQIGLIALRDLKTNAQNQGFLYLANKVGWLQNVHIYLDRVMQSYDSFPPIKEFDLNGFLLLGADDADRQLAFNNQLVIEGTISSMNGVGNASRIVPVYENGAPISPAGGFCASYRKSQVNPYPSPLDGICRARVVDLNYLRYYGPGLALCTGFEGPGAIANIPQDQALKAALDPAQGCNPANPAYDIDGNNLYSSDPATDMVTGAGTGVRSQYFVVKGLPATLQNEYPVNFFYRPISKDLAGFEVGRDINQVNR